MAKKYSFTNGQSRGKFLDMKDLFAYALSAKGSDSPSASDHPLNSAL
jgi:hypothetical protein